MQSRSCWRRSQGSLSRSRSTTKGETPMSLDSLIDSWKEVRAGLIDEAQTIPADQFAFKATPDMRSVAGVRQHRVEAEKTLSGGGCRTDKNPLRESVAEQIKGFSPGGYGTHDKERL